MATFKQIEGSFNQNFTGFPELTGQPAEVEDLGRGNYRATFAGLCVEFPVNEKATAVQLIAIREPWARRLREAVRKRV